MNIDRLLSLGAKRSDAKKRHRATVSVQGDDKCGKSHFLLTAPDPIAMIDMDKRAEEVLRKVQDEKEIVVLSPEIDRDAIMDAKKKKVAKGDKGATVIPLALHAKLLAEWERAASFMRDAEECGIRSLLIDTGDSFWELLRMVRFGKLDKVPSIAYTPVNMEFESHLKAPSLVGKGSKSENGMNLIVSHTVKAEYKNNESTGKKIRAGFSRMAYIADVSLELSYDEKKEEFKAKVRRCGFNPFWTGHVFGWDEEVGESEVDFGFIMSCLTCDDGADFGVVKTLAWDDREEWA